MGLYEFVGCSLIAFGAPLAIFILFIASDPLRIILFIGGAFVYLLSVLFTAIFWFIIPVLNEHIIITALLFILFQELFRYGYYRLLCKAQEGLEKVTVRGCPLDGVHPLKNATYTVAFGEQHFLQPYYEPTYMRVSMVVSGLGFGTMAGVVALLNLLADLTGPGTVGLPSASRLMVFHGDHMFFLISVVCMAALMLLHVMWNVVFWHGCKHGNWKLIVCVIGSHIACGCISLLNQQRQHIVTIISFYSFLIAFTIVAYIVAGGSKERLFNFFSNITCCGKKTPTQPVVVDTRL
ncbi:hypothetical protein D918_08094 [Trichuris suis]|nr:hypothetical protein D918_08094 [Trichuris suis]